MELFELKKLVCDKLKVAPWSVVDYNSQSVEVKIRGRKFLISTALCVCDAGARFYDANDSDARQLEKLLRGEQWDGTGLPPVGTECEVRYRHGGADWGSFKCVATDQEIAFGWCGDEPVVLPEENYEFRPLRTERDKAIDQMIKVFSSNAAPGTTHAIVAIYDAIVAGKIDGLGKVG